MKHALLLIVLGGLLLAGCTEEVVEPNQLAVSIEGQGSVSSSPPGIDCGQDCTESYEAGTSVTLTAKPAHGHSLKEWSGDAACRTSLVCSVEINQSKKVGAVFERNSDFCKGYEAPRISSQPDDFSGSLRWGIEEGCVQDRSWGTWTDSPVEQIGPADRDWYFVGSLCTISSAREDLLLRLTIANPYFVGMPGSGQEYSARPPASCNFSQTEMADLPSGEYRFQVGKVILRARANELGGFSIVIADQSPLREESFELKRFVRVNIPASSGGTTSVPGKDLNCDNGACTLTVSAGEAVELEAIPEEGFVADGWQGPGTEECQETTCLIRPLQSVSVRALFARERFQLVVENGEGGTISSRPEGILCGEDCQEEFEAGETIELFADPQEDWMFDGWQGDCQGVGACQLTMDSPKQVRASWKQFEAPEIRGPEIVRGPEEPFWAVQTTGGGATECSIEELEIYAGGNTESDDPTDSTRRYKGPCTASDTIENFLTPEIWPGRIDEDDEDVLEQTPGGSPLEQNGGTLDLPDGRYEVLVAQQLFYDSDPGDDQQPVLVGSGEKSKEFFLDRKAPEPIRFRDEPGKDEQEIAGDFNWQFSWGRDLTQQGPLWNQWRWDGQEWQEVSDPERAGVRCWIKPVEGGQVQDAVLLSTDWGECGTSLFNSEGDETDWATTPQGEWPAGTFGPGQNNVGNLQEGRYRLFVEQRDRAGYTTTTVLPFQRVQTFSLDSPNQDSVRFGATWQNIFVADTRQPNGSEGTIGEAWHPLRCRASGVGLLEDCLDDIDLQGTTAFEKAEELGSLEGSEELWERSFFVPEAEPGASYRAQGYLRLATPGRFESSRGDRRSMHVRLILDPVNKLDNADEEEENPWEGTYSFCNNPLATVNSANIIAQAAATQPSLQSDCQGTFPVQSNPRVYLRTQVEGIIAEGDPVTTQQPIEITPRSEYRPQNAITGNAEIHICQPGVPRSLDGESPYEPSDEDREEVLDVYDGQEGPLVRDSNRTEILGPVPDEGCQGHAMVWRWNDNILADIVVNTSQGYIYNGNPDICQALPREATFPAPPRLEEMAAGGNPVAQAVLGRVGSYRTGEDLPYQESNGKALWDDRGEGDPYVLASAPWSAIGRVRCSNGQYLGAGTEANPNGQWDLWLPSRTKPNLVADSQSTGQPSTVSDKGAVPPVTGPGFGTGLYSLPLPANLDGLPGTLDEGLLIDYELAPAAEAANGRNGYYWFMDARYYGYHLQRWAYSTDLDSERQDIEVLAPRSSR